MVGLCSDNASIRVRRPNLAVFFIFYNLVKLKIILFSFEDVVFKVSIWRRTRLFRSDLEYCFSVKIMFKQGIVFRTSNHT